IDDGGTPLDVNLAEYTPIDDRLPVNNRAQAISVQELVVQPYTFFTNAYQSVGLTGLATGTALIIVNNTDGVLLFSWDGTDDHHVILPYTYRELPVLAGASDFEAMYATAPTEGNCYFEVIQ